MNFWQERKISLKLCEGIVNFSNFHCVFFKFLLYFFKLPLCFFQIFTVFFSNFHYVFSNFYCVFSNFYCVFFKFPLCFFKLPLCFFKLLFEMSSLDFSLDYKTRTFEAVRRKKWDYLKFGPFLPCLTFNFLLTRFSADVGTIFLLVIEMISIASNYCRFFMNFFLLSLQCGLLTSKALKSQARVAATSQGILAGLEIGRLIDSLQQERGTTR